MSRSGTISSNGQELYYEVHGDGQPLVLVMGLGYDSSLWKLAQVPALSKQFRVEIFDNRDAGRSSRAAQRYSIGDMADDVAGLLDGLDIPHAHLLGLSMGGMIGQEFALRYPDRLDRLVLSGVGAAPARSAFDPIRIWSWVRSHDDTGEAFEAQQFVWLFSSSFLRNDAAVKQTLALLASNPTPMTPDAYTRQATAYLQHDVLGRGGVRVELGPDQMALARVRVQHHDRRPRPGGGRQHARELGRPRPVAASLQRRGGRGSGR